MGSDSGNERRTTEDITRATSSHSIDGFSFVMPENRVCITEDELFKHLVEMETTEFTVLSNENVSKISASVHNPNDFFDQMASERCQNGSFVQSLEPSSCRKRRKTVADGESELSDSKDARNSIKGNGNQDIENFEEQLDHKPAAQRAHSTNRHNLAERIRRERINERMKFLQGLVPGCDKIMGKAVMLDEIINYILSMQHQIEFLYRKLAAVNLSEKSQLLSNDILGTKKTISSSYICPVVGSLYKQSADGLVFMESAVELAMETSKVESAVRNQARAKLNQLKHDEPTETMTTSCKR
ncbi:hypothetical protein F511_22845 [Dorcoceras hygrometricum]|uniref:BHLH domain-containing protein n=1 Tax=Dorcoceras hygrometricum TaxID=472368 RepID=A0A2Z7ATV3_9LAMI|nr:hypothetical protein F511_22845 [Dorcoceras hygrometricum]